MLRITALVSLTLIASSIVAHAQAPTASAPSIVGEWTLNKDLSDNPRDQVPEGRGRDGDGGERRGGFGGRGGRGGRGGFGRGSGGAGANPEDVQRMRDALRDEMQAPERMTITWSGATVIITTADGRTTRLSTDGKKIKDESTKVERKTKWDGEKLVSEISGLGQGKITETYWVDSEHPQLHVTLQMEGARRQIAINRVYDATGR